MHRLATTHEHDQPTGSFPHPLRGGVNTPNFRTTPPALGGKDGERKRGGRGKGKGIEEGKGPPKVG